MVEKEEIFSSGVKFGGLFSFKSYYKFCYEWLTEEIGLDVAELKYKEKVAGDTKEIEVKWEGTKKITDYFKYLIKATFMITDLKKVEIQKVMLKFLWIRGELNYLLKEY